MKSKAGYAALLFALFASGLFAAPADTPPNAIPPEVKARIETAIANGLAWLAAQQKEDGSWSNRGFPALTAMPLECFLGGSHPARSNIMERAVTFILSHVQKDGGIYRSSLIPGRGGLGNYNTSVCMTALHALGDPKHKDIILNARKYVADSQLTGDDTQAGGFGYGQGGWRRSTDLMNTMHSIEAMRLTQDVEDLRPGGKRVDLNWEKAIKYIAQLQNKPEAGANEAGGFIYKPGSSTAGTTNTPEGVVVFRSYGSMTYVGLLAMLYATVDRTDARVQSAFDWACRHWSLEENPGLGKEGMYFFYHVLARALTTYGQPLIPREGKPGINWRVELADKLVSLQKTDPKTGLKYWINETGRYWENDPVLVTSYTILALEQILKPGK